MKVNESAENYLEAIFMLKKKNGFVRSIDVAHELEFTKASVSVAMKSFREKGYIVIDGAGGISLTPSGLEIAEKVYERHNVIASALMALGVNKDTAFEDSCKIEHVISDESFEKLKEFLNKQK
ncbi:MAG: metal-dependent transcriptional regulator [Ruminococcaceae bacterium]|nr:metal-dependent transcriptional regulator [Oscillospiraceae bacterium]